MLVSEFEKTLKDFLRLLKKERMYLIKGQSELLPSLVEQKEAYIPLFEEYNQERTEKIKKLIAQIQMQQQENLLLTKQAIAYQETLLKAVSETIKTANFKTYGNPQEKNSVSNSMGIFDTQE